MTRTTTKKKNSLVYINKTTYVNADTGEEIIGSKEYINANYKRLQKEETKEYTTHSLITKTTWLLKRKPTQMKLL